jgi:hypothetical protein
LILTIDQILELQGIKLVRSWFLRYLTQQAAVPESQIATLHNLVALPQEVSVFLRSNELRLSHTLLIYERTLQRYLDPAALAQALGFPGEQYGILRSDARDTFQLQHGTEHYRDSDFGTPEELRARLRAAGIEAVFGTVEFDFGLWRKLPQGAFDAIPTVVMLVGGEDNERVPRLEGFAEFRSLELRAGLDASIEQ